jgi:hypothetical protein
MTPQLMRGGPPARLVSRALLALAFGAAAAPSVGAQPSQAASTTVTLADREAVRRAVLDYVEGFYEGDSAKLARSVRPEVYKYGFWRPRDSTSYAGEQMTWPEFFSYAASVRKNNRQAPPTAPKRIELYDVQNQSASAKLTASCGTDYLVLGRYDGKWMVSSVMWQSPPKAPAPAGGGDDGGAPEEAAVEPFENELLATDNVFRGTFAPDGRTFLFFRKVAKNQTDEEYRILESRLVNGRWTAPTRLTLGGDYSDLYPTISPDGRRMVFSSYRPVAGDTSSHRNAHLWYVDRQGDGWSAPVFMAKPSLLGYYNSGPQFLSDGSVYWNATTPDWKSQTSYVTRWNGREYSAPVVYETAERWRSTTPDRRVSMARLAPDSSFAILEIATVEQRRQAPPDLYVSYRIGGQWSDPKPLRGGVNTQATENFVTLSPDAKYIYFVRDFSGFYRVPVQKALAGTR